MDRIKSRLLQILQLHSQACHDRPGGSCMLALDLDHALWVHGAHISMPDPECQATGSEPMHADPCLATSLTSLTGLTQVKDCICLAIMLTRCRGLLLHSLAYDCLPSNTCQSMACQLLNSSATQTSFLPGKRHVNASAARSHVSSAHKPNFQPQILVTRGQITLRHSLSFPLPSRQVAAVSASCTACTYNQHSLDDHSS